MKENLISVIVPVYNVEQYLRKCIDSIISQTYKNLEIILVDDGSKDNSGKICDEYENKDERIKVIHKKNGGLSDTRNIGLDIAKGDFISFIDSDDIVENDFFEYLIGLQKKYNSDITECNFVKVYEEKLKDFAFPKNSYHSIVVTDSYGALKNYTSFDDDISTNSVVVWNKIYKKELFEKVRFPVGKTHEDQYTMYKLLAQVNIFVTSSEAKYGYFQRADSIINKKFNEDRLSVFDAYDEVIEFLHQKNYTELEEKFQRRYLQTIIDFTDITSKLEKTEKKNFNRKLIELFENRYEKTENFVKNSDIYKDRLRFYLNFKDEFYYKISK